jgi:gingipain R
MKKIILTILLLCSVGLYAKDYTATYNEPSSNQYQVTFNIDNWNLKDVVLDNNSYSKIIFSSTTTTEREGWAELPFVSTGVQLPSKKDVTYEVTYSEYTDIQLENPLVPSRGTLYRNQDPKSIPYKIDPNSIVDEFYPKQIASIDDPFIVRDVRGTVVRVFPFQYNAVTKTLRVYTTIEVTLTEIEGKATNPLLVENYRPVKEAIGMYQSMFINFDKTRYDYVMANYGEILVLCTERDQETIEPYIQWKREKGFIVHKEIVATGTNVKNIIKEKYEENNNILFVQIIGDWEDLKCDVYTDGSPQDPKLGCVVGTDNFPEIAIGRFSCSNATELETQMNKSINYEKNPFTDEEWYSSAIGIGSSEGGGYNGDDGEQDKVHIQNIYDSKLEPFTYNTMLQNYDPGANASTLASHLNQGASTLMYCGHGNTTLFGTTGFNNSNINQLTNGEKLPFIVACACFVGSYNASGDCFAERWLKKENGGAVLTLMSSISQPWEPPMRGQDYFYDLLIGGYNYDEHPGQNGINTDEQRTTWGSIVVNSLNLMLLESQQSSDISTAHTWITFGDASLQLRTKNPDEIVLSNDVIIPGSNFETVVTSNGEPIEGAMVCISQDDNYYRGITDENGTVSIANEITPGAFLLVVTGFNTSTIYQEAMCIAPEGPYLIADGYTLDGDGKLESGETAILALTMKNVGLDPTTTPTNVTLTSESSDITIIEGTAEYGIFEPDASLTIDGVYTIKAAEGIDNGSSYPINIVASNGNETWESVIFVKVYAPIVEYSGFVWKGSFEPGDEFPISINFTNKGGATAQNAIATLTTSASGVTITEDTYDMGNIAEEGVSNAIFNIILADDIDPNSSIEFNATLVGDNFEEITADLTIANACDLVFKMQDTYGDGWNGNARIQVTFDNGDPTVYVKLYDGSLGYDTINVKSGVGITLSWETGWYDYEDSFTLYYAGDEENIICEISNPGFGILFEFTADCAGTSIAIEPVMNLTATVEENNHVTLTWNHSDPASVDSYIIKRDGLEIGVTNELTFTDENTENATTYNYCVVAVTEDIESIPECTLVEVGTIITCDPVTNLTVVNNHNYTLTATWTGNNAANNYKVTINGELAATVTTEEYTTDELEEGNYVICVTAVYPTCESEEECADSEDIVGIENFNDGIIVYPNPAEDIINIEGANISVVNIYNNLGQLVISKENSNSINISSLNAGIYMINIITEEGSSLVKKVVIK